MKTLEGFVAFLDVLGFQDLLQRDERLKEVGDYIEAVQRAVSGGDGALQFTLFSDSVIINTRDNQDRSAERLFEACARIFGFLLLRHLPLRGAISHGSFIRSDETGAGTIVAGRPIVEAIRTEQRQDWAGVILAPSAVRRFPDLITRTARGHGCHGLDDANALRSRLPWLLYLQQHQSVPMHTEQFGDPDCNFGYAVVPVPDGVNSPTSWQSHSSELLAAADRMRELAPDPKSQRKCRALRDFVANGQAMWNATLRTSWFNMYGDAFNWNGP